MGAYTMTIGVAGLGLIGGSLAKAIKEYTTHRVLGFDISSEVMQTALAAAAIDGILDDGDLYECDCVLVALYPEEVRRYVRPRLEMFKKGALVVDCAGVKSAVCEELSAPAAAAGVHFIGGHPMAGIERSGFANSFAELFKGASMILCPDSATDAVSLAAAESLFLSIGFGSIKLTDAAEHDRMIAFTSQLAHITSSAYIKSPVSPYHKGFSANSFKDLTRVARLDENMWTLLFFENRDCLLAEAEGLAQRLNEYIQALRSGDRDTMKRLLKDGRLAKEAAE